MEVYFGGAFQGKLDYVLKKKGNLKVADGRDCDEKRLQSADVVNHLHLLIQRRIISEKWDMVREWAEKAGFLLETHMVQGEWNACVFKKTDDISGVIGG